MPNPPSITPTMAVGINRQLPVPACSIKLADLKQLFEMLNRKASEATTEQLGQLQRSVSQSDEQFEAMRQEVRNLMALTVRIQGASGEWRVANSIEAFSEESLPAVITDVLYECGGLYRARFNLFPQNSFSVAIDFRRTPLGDLTNLSSVAGLGPSLVSLSGVNVTWVNAVDLELRTFFADRATRRGWLYSRYAYDLAVVFIGFPVCLDAVYILDKRLASLVTLPPAIFVALYVYLVLVGLFVFRILFNYIKWVIPKIEGPPQKRGGAALHKTILGAIFLALLIRVVTTVLWLAGIHLH
jgi:hypothetical protein